jgi:lysophospholipase L1-like esterase
MAIDPNITDFIAQAVSKFGLSPTQPIDVSDPLTRLSMAVIITNIEQGRDIYSYDQFVKGSAMSAGLDPDTYNTLVSAVSLGFENFQAAGGFVSPASTKVSSGGSSVPTNLSSYVQAAEVVAKVSASSIDSIISSTQAILAINALNGINPLTGLTNGISAPTGVNTDNPIGNFFSGIGQKVTGAVNTVTDALGITTSNNNSAVTGSVADPNKVGSNDSYIVISMGSNDVGTVSATKTQENLTAAIAAAKQAGYPTENIIVTIPALAGARERIINAIAANPGVKSIDAGSVPNDGLHPSAEGYKQLGDKVAAITGKDKEVTCEGDSLCSAGGIGDSINAKYGIDSYSNGNIGKTSTYLVNNEFKNLDSVADSIPAATPFTPNQNTFTPSEAAKAAQTVAKENGFTVETPVSVDGKIVGWVATNPITKDTLVFNQLNGKLIDSAGTPIKTPADLTPGLDTVLTEKGYTYAVPNSNGSITYTRPPESTESPPDLTNSVTIGREGAATFAGGARYDVGATLAGLRLDAAGIKQISDTAATTPIFGGSTPTASLATTAGTISANYSSLSVIGPGAAINTAFGQSPYAIGGTMAQYNLVGYGLAQGQASDDLVKYQTTYDSNNRLLSNYQTQLNVTDNQLAIVNNTLKELETTQLDSAKLIQTDALLKESENLRTLNTTAQGLEDKIKQLDSNITNSPDADLIKGWEVEKQAAVIQKDEILAKIDESNQRLNDISSSKITLDDTGVTVDSVKQQIETARAERDLLITNKLDLSRNIAETRDSLDQTKEVIAKVTAAKEEAAIQVGLPQKIADLNQQITDQSNYIKMLSSPSSIGIADRAGKLKDAESDFNALVAQRDEAVNYNVQGPQLPAGWKPLDTNVTTSNITAAYEANNTNAAVAISLQGANGQLAYDSSTGNYYLNGYQTDSTGLRVSNVPNTATPIGTPVDSVDTARLLSETVPGEIYYSTTEKGTTYYQDGEVVNLNGDKLADITTGDPTGGDFSQIPTIETPIDYGQYTETAQITPLEPAYTSIENWTADI